MLDVASETKQNTNKNTVEPYMGDKAADFIRWKQQPMENIIIVDPCLGLKRMSLGGRPKIVGAFRDKAPWSVSHTTVTE